MNQPKSPPPPPQKKGGGLLIVLALLALAVVVLVLVFARGNNQVDPRQQFEAKLANLGYDLEAMQITEAAGIWQATGEIASTQGSCPVVLQAQGSDAVVSRINEHNDTAALFHRASISPVNLSVDGLSSFLGSLPQGC